MIQSERKVGENDARRVGLGVGLCMDLGAGWPSTLEWGLGDKAEWGSGDKAECTPNNAGGGAVAGPTKEGGFMPCHTRGSCRPH